MSSLIDTYTSILSTAIQLDELEYEVGGLRNNLMKFRAEANKLQSKQFGLGRFGSTIAFIFIVIGFICASFWGAIAVFLIYVLICFVIDSLFFEKGRKKRMEQLQTEEIEPTLKLIKEYEDKIAEVYNTDEITYFETHFPPECQSIEALQFFVEALLYGKAETEKELYNLWAEESYRQQMLQMQSKQILQNQSVIENQKQQTSALEQQNRLLQQQTKQQRKLSRQVRYGNVISTLDLLKDK